MRKVYVEVRSIGDPTVSFGVPGLETDGSETAAFTLDQTDVAPGQYLLRSLVLTGSGSNLGSHSYYRATSPEASYILGATPFPQVAEECSTSIPAASFVVVNE